MTYLIAQLGLWLLLTGAFAALAGWAWAAWRAAPAAAALRRDRERLLKDIVSISGETGGGKVAAELDRELDTLRRRADLDAARIAEMDRALQAARARADEATSRIAVLEREGAPAPEHTEELDRLRQEVAVLEREQAREIEVQDVAPQPAAPVFDEEQAALTTWRLRYFEQRVRYLESLPPPAAPEPAPEFDPAWEWRAREAEARVAHLEEGLRRAAEAEAAPADEPPFAADAEADKLLRWRMLYLERRTAHLEAERANAAEAAARNAVDYDEAETWKWRSRFLEARTRYLDGRLAALSEAVQRAPAQSVAVAPALATPAPKAERPASLPAARGGAPDDFRLIEGVSALQQNTLYALGIYHFDQIAAWTPANVAWIDAYLRLRGRVEEEEWVEQAEDLARDGVAAARGAQVEEEA